MKSEMVIIKLIEKIKDDSLLVSMVSDTLRNCSKYVDLIHRQDVLSTVEKYVMSKEEKIEKILYLDNQRNKTHNCIISGLKTINKLCTEYGLDKFYQGNEDDRYDIADFVMLLVTSSFKNRKK